MFAPVMRKALYGFVILSMVFTPVLHPLAAQAASERANSDALPHATLPDPLERVRAYLPDDPHTQAIDGALGGLPGGDWGKVVGVPSYAQPSSMLESFGSAFTALPEPTYPQVSPLMLEIPDVADVSRPEPARPQAPAYTADMVESFEQDDYTRTDAIDDEGPSTPEQDNEGSTSPWSNGFVPRLNARNVVPTEPTLEAQSSIKTAQAEHPAPPNDENPSTEANSLHFVYLPYVASRYSYSDNVITPEAGGEYRSPDAEVHLYFAPDTVDQAITVQHEPTEAPDVPTGVVVGTVFELTAHTLSGVEVTQFNRPVQIVVQYQEEQLDGVPEIELALYYWDQDQETWMTLSSTVDVENNLIYAATNHFSTFGVLGGIFNDFTIDTVCWWPGNPGYQIVDAKVISLTPDVALFYTGRLEVAVSGHDSVTTSMHIEVYDADAATMTVESDPVGPYSVGATASFTMAVTEWWLFPIGRDVYTGTFQFGSEGCVSGGGGCEHDPPTIDYIDIWQSGTGFSIVTVKASDTASEVSVALEFNGEMRPMTPMGGDIFVTRVDYPIFSFGKNSYQVKAIDGCGNYTKFPGNPVEAWPSVSGSVGNFCLKGPCGGFRGSDGDPVDTFSGSFGHSTVDATVAGIGGTTLTLERNYNSAAALWPSNSVMRYTDDGSGGVDEGIFAGPPQYFGPGWTFPFGAYLLVVDKAPFYQGVQIHYADGHTVLFTDNGDGTYASDSPMNFDTLTYEGGEFVLLHKRTREVERFSADGQLTAIEDRNGNAITFTYNGDRLERVENDSGRWMEFGYNGDGLIDTISMPENVTLYYEYDNGLLKAFINGRGKRVEYEYNAEGQLTEVKTPKTHPALRLEYDPDDGRVTEQIVGENELRSFVYSDDGTVTTMTDAYGAETIHHYDDQSRLVQIEYDDGTSEYFDYDGDFNRIYHRDQENQVWRWTFDRGNRLTEEGPLGWYREWEYDDDLDLVTRMVEQVNVTTTRETTFDYDGRGNLTEICNPLDDCSTMEYDAHGLLTDVWDFARKHTYNTYDAEGDLDTVTNAEHETIRFGHDGLGRMVEMRTPLNYVYTYGYDPNSNLVAVDGPLGYHLGFSYDPNDNLETEFDANGGAIVYGYDPSENLTSVSNQLDFTTVYTYGTMNELTGFQDAEERVWTYAYNEMLRMTDIYGPLDTHTQFAYDAMGNPTDVTDPLDRVVHTEYDELYRAMAVTLNYIPGEPENADTNVTTTYEYDLLGNVLRIVDPENNPTEYEYDLLGQVTWMRDAENQVWEYEYDPMGNLTLILNPRKYPTAFQYDDAHRLYKIIDADTEITTFEYDADGNMTGEVDPEGIVTHYVYNELDRLEQEIRNYIPGVPEDAKTNVTTEYAYDPAGNLRFVTDPRDYEAEFRYDAAHRLEDTFDYEGARTHFEYDRVNNLLSVTDDNNHTTHYVYDDLDRRESITNAQGHSITFVYDKVGNLTDMVDANGNPTHYDVDALGRVVRMVDALTGEWLYEYNRVGKVLVETDANTHPTTYTYDKVYRLRTVTDAEGCVSEFLWDENGNLIEFIDGNQNSTWYEYDPLDRLEAMTNAELERTEYRYDPLGNQTHLVEADGTVTLYGYDPLYRLDQVTENYVDGEPSNNDTNVITHYVYDPSGNMVEFINANGKSTFFEHDGMGRLVREIDPLLNTWEYTYDGVGNRLTRLDANGALTEYAYYPDDQLERIDYEDGTFVVYQYDPNNNRTEMIDNLGTTTWTYDALDRVTDTLDPFDRALHYEYDPVGNRTEIVYPDGNPVAYTHYRNNWLKTVTDPKGGIIHYTRDCVGNITRIVNPNSTVSDVTYDKVDRVLTLVNRQTIGARKTNSAFDYTYNEVGHVIQVVNEYGWRNPSVVTETYTYDGLHRLAGMSDSEGVVMAYAYDPVGNRLVWETNDDLTSQTPFDGFVTTYQYNAANQLTQFDMVGDNPVHDMTAVFQYDANGNRINKEWNGPQGTPTQGTDYTYDPENRLMVVQDYQHKNDKRVDRAITTLEYDGGGRRLAKSYDPKVGGGGVDKRVEYVFDGLNPVAEYSMLNGQRENFYRGAQGRIVAMQHFRSGTLGQMYWYHYNFKGDVSGLTKHHGQSTHNYRYDPYGGVIPDHGNFTDPHNHYTLTGKEFDENIGLMYFGARHYDPATATWQTQDTFRGMLSSPKSLHRYSYVYGNPVSYYDAYGHWPKFLDDAVDKVSEVGESIGNFVEEHKEGIVKGVAIGAAVVAATAITVVTAGAGAPAAAIILSATVAGAGAAAAGTVGANVTLGRDWDEDIVENTLIGGSIGFGIGTAGALNPTAFAAAPKALGATVAASTGSSFLGGVFTYGTMLSTGTMYGGLGLAFSPFVSPEDRQIGSWMFLGGSLATQSFYFVGGLINYYANQANSCSPEGTPQPPSDPAKSPGKRWEWRGTGDPGTSQGSWYDPTTGESLHPDLNHSDPIGPHWDYTDPNSNEWRIYPDGTKEPK